MLINKINRIKLYLLLGVRISALALFAFITLPSLNGNAEEHSSPTKEESSASEGEGEGGKSEKKEGAG